MDTLAEMLPKIFLFNYVEIEKETETNTDMEMESQSQTQSQSHSESGEHPPGRALLDDDQRPIPEAVDHADENVWGQSTCAGGLHAIGGNGEIAFWGIVNVPSQKPISIREVWGRGQSQTNR